MMLTPQQWDQLVRAEASYYPAEGPYAWTAVNRREESAGSLAATLWAAAADNVEAAPWDDEGYELTGSDVEHEVARRVAHTLAVLAFGVAFTS
jgi:hypothetical protein